jgi:hypothetical protein
MRNGFRCSCRAEQHDLAWLVRGSNGFRVLQGSSSRCKAPTAAIKVNNSPPSLFGGNDVDGSPCGYQHPFILAWLLNEWLVLPCKAVNFRGDCRRHAYGRRQRNPQILLEPLLEVDIAA